MSRNSQGTLWTSAEDGSSSTMVAPSTSPIAVGLPWLPAPRNKAEFMIGVHTHTHACADTQVSTGRK